MALIPVFKKCSRYYLEKEWNVEFPLSDWVEAEIDNDLYETNRYDIIYRDILEKKNISVYLYMNESSDEVLAIDEIVQDLDKKARYILKETPFSDMLRSIMTMENASR